ncbi:MAG: porphobilinogen synthase [Alphaproteobacteria bacterium]|nr:porphobilinogen synthase [Alphaproteobacteria bacterium]
MTAALKNLFRPAAAPATTKFSAQVGGFPRTRMRRNRADEWTRRLVAEHRVSVDDLIWAVILVEGQGVREPIPSMPHICRLSPDVLLEEAKQAHGLGVPALAIFPAFGPEGKDATGSMCLNPHLGIYRAIRSLRRELPTMGVIADVALDPFTDHAHDGVLRDGVIVNDDTIDIMCKQAHLLADAGCDMIAPSDMMDGRIGALRDYLDDQGYENVRLLSYAAKYASGFYGPYRDALKNKGLLKGDKKTYQMDPANTDEAMREVALDVQEGADLVMVKPGMPYLDIIHRIKTSFGVPVVAFQVSGEYAMLRAATEAGWLDYPRCLMESLTCFKRAGADAIVTYAAIDAARILVKASGI